MAFNYVAVAVGFVLQTADKVITAFLNHNFRKEKSQKLPQQVEIMRQDQRIRQAEIDYYNRREAREQELLKIQELRLVTDLKIAAGKAEREEKALQLKQDELEDRRKLSALYLDLMREKNAKEIELKRQEIQAIFDQQKWTGVLSRDEAQRIFIDEQNKPRLLILVPPPDISEDFPLSFRDSLNKEIRNQLKIFLEKSYPLNSDLCPVEFYGKYFERSVFDAEVKQLETILSAVPTAIIYTDITDHEVYFNVRFWGLNESISLSFDPWNWEEAKQEIEKNGNDEKQSFRVIRQTIVTLHKLLAAFLADWYYLNIDPNYEPQLLKLDSEIPSTWTKTIIEKLGSIKKEYSEVYNNELKLLSDWQNKKTQPWKCVNTLNQHANQVRSVVVNPHGKTFASGSLDNTIRIWNLDNGELNCTFTGNSYGIYSIAFSPDGQTLASGSNDNIVKLWYSRTGTNFVGHSGYIASVAFHPDGKIIASGSSDKTIKIWNLNTEELICTFTGHEGCVNSVVFTIDGKFLISGSDDKIIKIWDIETGLAVHTLTEHTMSVCAVAVSPDNETFASSSADNTVKIWNISNGKLIYEFSGHTNRFNSLAFSLDGKVLASGSWDGSIKLWHLGIKELITTLTGHTNDIRSVAFSPDGKTIVSGSNDTTIKIWKFE